MFQFLYLIFYSNNSYKSKKLKKSRGRNDLMSVYHAYNDMVTIKLGA